MWKRLQHFGISGEFLGTLQSLYTGDNVDCMVNGLATQPVFLKRGLRQGCSLSPMLFALYIADIGNDINASELGFNLGNICVSGLLFADDIVLVARSPEGLLQLLEIVKRNCDLLKLSISTVKSQIVSPIQQEWSLFENDDRVLTLKQVAQYKYLGTFTFGSMWRTSLNKQEKCVKTANKYKGSCMYVSKEGPDVVDVLLCTWNNVAIPAILFGTEMMPFTDETVSAIERVQSGVAKFALGLPYGTPNFCAQTELGMKPFRQVLYERQLGFYLRVLFLHDSRWVKVALMDHLSGEWQSPYIAYITEVRSRLGMSSIPPSAALLKLAIKEWFLSDINNSVANSSLLLYPLDCLNRAHYVCEHEHASTFSQFRLGVAGLGNKAPRLGRHRQRYCPLCPTQALNCEYHLVCVCPAIHAKRAETGITSFINHCTVKGIPLVDVFKLFVMGLDSNGKLISRSDVLERGHALHDLKECWLGRW